MVGEYRLLHLTTTRDMSSRLKVIALDTFWGAYLAITIHRVLWYHVVLGSSSPDFEWTSLGLYGAVGLVYALLASLSGASLSARIIESRDLTGWRRELTTHTAWILIVLTVVTGWVVSRVSIADLFSQQRLDAAGRLFRDLLSPDFSNTQLLSDALKSIVETIYIAFMATAFALPFSFILAFLSARNLMKVNPIAFTVYNILRVFTNFTRSIEPLVWAVIFTVWVKVGPFPGMLALCVHTIASLAKQYSEQIEDVDEGPMEAIEATGARPLQVIWFAVVPQVFIPFLSFTIYRWDINVRMATIIGLVGGGGIGSMLIQYQMLADWKSVGMIVLIIAVVVWIMDYLSARVREALR